ncbi:MAG: SDR family NAD(P)-dependent oxidoreductase [Proteobacteria bacterium]|nr:SDR family NAD(P)-dependent oxidoreductase [Pseudomonadota bacterium]MBI3499984.1 SDR family NAD(P)-dependent oxidoreductase [Pseudomonadota bacterium]
MTQAREARVVMISGAARGIGLGIARVLAERGWQLSLGVREPAKLPAALTAKPHMAHRYEARDVKSGQEWAEATAGRYGRIDAVVANAGIIIRKSVVEASDEDVDQILDVNVKAPLRLARAAWPWLTKCGQGRVVTIASLAAKRVPRAPSGLYSVSKFAALGLSHAIRHAGWDSGIRAIAICPGFVATDMTASMTTQYPAEKMTQPEDIGRIVALALDLPNTTSISEIPVNCQLDPSY